MTAVGSGPGLEMAMRLGASEVWDRRAREMPGPAGGVFHVVFDAAAASRWRIWRRAITPGGAFVTTLPTRQCVVDKLTSLALGPRAHLIAVKSRRADRELLAGWLAFGEARRWDASVSIAPDR